MSEEHKLRRGGTPCPPAPILQGDPFAPYKAKPTTAEWMILVLLLALAAFLRLYRLSDAPPGIHDDEIINAQIADQLRAGAPFSIFYEAGEGREGLYHPLLVASRALTAQVPHWYRLPSVVCGLSTILLVYHLSRRWFGPWAALVAVGGLAVAFWPVHLGREALRVVTFPPLSVGMALALWRGLAEPRLVKSQRLNQSNRGALGWFALAGLLLGLTQYTYLAARVLPLFLALFIAFLAIFHRARLFTHRWGLTLCVAIGAIVAAPALIYIATHWGEQQRIMTLKGPLEAFLVGDPRPVLSSTVKTLGMFVWRGDPQPHYNLPGRPVFGPVSGILFLAGVLIALLDLRHPASAFCLLWTMTALVPGMLTQPAPHFSRTAGALVTTFVFPGLAARWTAKRLGPKGRIGLAVALGLILSVNAGLTFRDYFLRWTELKEVRAFHHAGLAEMARYLDHSPEAIADTTPIAACTPFLNEAHFFWRTDRQALRYLLNRRDLQIGWYSCLEAQLFPRGGEEARYLFGGEWDFASFTPPELTGQAQTIAEFRGGRLARLDAARAGEYGLENWLAQMSRPEAPSSTISFGEMMTFRGYRIAPDAPAPGAELEVLTAWEVDSAPPQNLSIFLHLFDSDGTLLTQGDALAALSDTLHPGDVFLQRHKLALPPDMPPGEYRLKTGLYVRGGARIHLASSADDALILETVKIGDDNN
jgi:4-amino-4-deoxy-L-arabinose transferase-like glycosyltransferase